MSSSEHLPPFAARLEPARRELELDAITPLVEELSHIPLFRSAVVFTLDGWHRDSAGAVAHVSAPGVTDEFTNRNIVGHRIDTNPSTTTAGKTFETRKSQLSPSLMNPDGHIVWGAYMAPDGDSEASILQLAFDKSQPLPSEKNLADVWKKYGKIITEATESLVMANHNRLSLLDDLLLEEAVSPNGFVIKWDVSGSTKMVDKDYQIFNHYVQELKLRIDLLANNYDGRIVSHNGDGQNIVINLPTGINRNDLAEVGAFGQLTAANLVNAILTANAQISPSYGKLEPHIRISLGLGNVELSRSGEETGTVFWDANNTLESLPRYANSAGRTTIARHALSLARQYK